MMWLQAWNCGMAVQFTRTSFLFDSHFPDKPRLACCLLDFQSINVCDCVSSKLFHSTHVGLLTVYLV